MRRQATAWKTMTDKRLVSKMHEEISEIDNLKNPLRKWSKSLNRYFTKKINI